jgi:hypothetical protein
LARGKIYHVGLALAEAHPDVVWKRALTSVPLPQFEVLRSKDFRTSETIRALDKLLKLVVLYVFEVPKTAGSKVVGTSKTHH